MEINHILSFSDQNGNGVDENETIESHTSCIHIKTDKSLCEEYVKDDGKATQSAEAKGRDSQHENGGGKEDPPYCQNQTAVEAMRRTKDTRTWPSAQIKKKKENPLLLLGSK